MQYRPEIDGLRAIAVLSVIFYHIKLPFIDGGYLGVDIFFVISGFLITSLIAQELDAGNFSIRNFYERRIRRIFPALYLVTLVTIPFAIWILTPQDLTQFFQSIVAVTLFVSNLFFYLELDYWSTDIDLVPLIHTWTLAVEEQFYILFPLLLMLLATFKKSMTFSAIIILAVVSFGLAVMTINDDPSLAFYSIHTRAWELMLGALAALIRLNYSTQMAYLIPQAVQKQLANLGLITILLSLILISKLYPHPGSVTLFPTIGTCLLLLFATPASWSFKLLTQKSMILVGLVSYSAYLWHQPLFALYKQITPSQSAFSSAMLVGLTLLLSYFSWRFVEKPFRNRQFLAQMTIFKLALACMTIVGLMGVIAVIKTSTELDDAMDKLASDVNKPEMRLKNNYGLNIVCDKNQFVPQCVTNEAPNIAVWGDSHAMHIVEAITATMPEDSGLIQLTKSSCGPVVDLTQMPKRLDGGWVKSCFRFNKSVMSWLSANTSVTHVVMASPFYFYIDPQVRVQHRDGRIDAGNFDLAVKEFLKTIDAVKALGKEVVIIAPPPRNNTDLGKCLLFSANNKLDLDRCNFPRYDIYLKSLLVYEFLKMIEGNGHHVIWLHELMCDEQTCVTHLDGDWLYRDKGHLSIEGSRRIGLNFDLYGQIISVSEETEKAPVTEN